MSKDKPANLTASIRQQLLNLARQRKEEFQLLLIVSVPRTALQSVDEVYGGVRQASQMMQEMGIPRSIRKQVLESFDVRTLTVRTAGDAEFGIRYFDNIDAFPRGRFLFETFPASRDSLALQTQWNQMTGFQTMADSPRRNRVRGRNFATGSLARRADAEVYL